MLKSCLEILFVAGFGLASHLGVLADIPSVGVGKKLYHVDGLVKGPDNKQRVKPFPITWVHSLVFVTRSRLS